jgi:hypothetical protein
MTTAKCAVGKALDDMNGDDREETQGLLDNSLASVIISKWLTDVRKYAGCSIALVTKHRHQDCECF